VQDNVCNENKQTTEAESVSADDNSSTSGSNHSILGNLFNIPDAANDEVNMEDPENPESRTDTRCSTLSSLSQVDLACFEVRRMSQQVNSPWERTSFIRDMAGDAAIQETETQSFANAQPSPITRCTSVQTLSRYRDGQDLTFASDFHYAPNEHESDSTANAPNQNRINESPRRRERHRSDPFGSRSSSGSNESTGIENWYYYDPRLRNTTEGNSSGDVPEMWSYLQALRNLHATPIVLTPPSYEDTIGQPVNQLPNINNEVLLPPPSPPPPPPPYVETDPEASSPDREPPSYDREPPSYEQAIQESPAPDLDAVHPLPLRTEDESFASATVDERPLNMTRCFSDDFAASCATSSGARLFGGMPAVRWNRNMQVNRWTSLPSWVASS
jgi:hypothetical protein